MGILGQAFYHGSCRILTYGYPASLYQSGALDTVANIADDLLSNLCALEDNFDNIALVLVGQGLGGIIAKQVSRQYPVA